MKYKWIAFYVSSHGFGHMTRNLAIIEEILEKTNYHIYLTSGEYQNDFAKFYLSKYGNRIIYKNMCTDIGLINYPGTLEVNKKVLEESLLQFINSWEKEVSKEYQFLLDYDIHSVISDVSVFCKKKIHKIAGFFSIPLPHRFI